MKTLAFVVALLIAGVGAVGVFAPSGLVWVAENASTSGAFYLVGAVRLTFGLVLVSVAPDTRVPKVIRVVGWFIVLAGIASVLTALLGMERARAMIDWWLGRGTTAVRLTGVLIMAFGGFIAFACAPTRLRSTGSI